MAIWGKIIGVAAGLALGGPIGALIGGIGGHFVDKMGEEEIFDPNPFSNASREERKQAKRNFTFTIGIIILGAKMAKADGRVTPEEIAAFKQVFRIPAEDMAEVGKLFNQAKQDVAGFEPYAKQIAHEFKDSPAILEELLWCLTFIAKADGIIHPYEVDFLGEVSRIFGFDQATFERITDLNEDLGSSAYEGSSLAHDYMILGVKPDDDFDKIKAAYRALARKHHPDNLVAKGMPTEFIDQANQIMAKINDAYERIKKSKSKGN